MNEQLILFIIPMVCFLFWFVYELMNPAIDQEVQEKYDKLFGKFRETGNIKLKMYYFRRSFLRIVIISQNEVKQYYYLSTKGTSYRKFYTSKKIIKNEVQVLHTKTDTKSN